LNELEDEHQEQNNGMPEDCDDIDFGNYKGIYANDDVG
jgi:hypothetical protein